MKLRVTNCDVSKCGVWFANDPKLGPRGYKVQYTLNIITYMTRCQTSMAQRYFSLYMIIYKLRKYKTIKTYHTYSPHSIHMGLGIDARLLHSPHSPKAQNWPTSISSAPFKSTHWSTHWSISDLTILSFPSNFYLYLVWQMRYIYSEKF